MQPGIYPDLDIAKYHKSVGVSKTSLCKLDRAPKVLRDYLDNPGSGKKSRSLTTGSIFHLAMEGAFERDCRVSPEVPDKRCKQWKDFVKAHPNHFCVTPAEAQTVMNMRSAMLASAAAREYLTRPGRFEVSYYWLHKLTGTLCKCRPDWISADQSVVIDFKTAADVTEDRFVRDALRYHYHVSAALTVDGIHTITGIRPRYIFLAIEPLSPHLTSAFEATADDLRLGRSFIRRNLALLRRCEENGTWPGLPEEIRALDVQRFLRNTADQDTGDDNDVDADVSDPLPANYWE
jgi:exodeoxyribonuclease VIII